MKNKNYQKWSIGLLLIASLIGFNHCVVQPPKKATRRPENATNQATTSTPTSTLPTTQSSPEQVVVVDTKNPNEDFFNNSLVPTFKQKCIGCHTEPFNNPPVQGPLSIYLYDSMKSKLLSGQSDLSNDLINKVKGVIGHTGGNQCPNGDGDTVCQLIRTWYAGETNTNVSNPTPLPEENPGPTGEITGVTSMGKINGYAGDKSKSTDIFEVALYLDGPAGSGNLMGTVKADQGGFNGGISGSHAFTFYIPVYLRDGTPHQLYAYIKDGANDIPLMRSPWSFTAYSATAAGFDYYTNTLKPMLLNRCNNCHAVTYDSHYPSLITPSPAEGGTESSNQMIDMPSGAFNGTNHPGGKICSTKDSSPCKEIKEWWRREFQ